MSSNIASGGDPATRALILDAGVSLLRAEAPGGLSMGAVAARAGVSRQALYLHFRRHSDLVLAVVDHANDRLGLPERLAQLTRARTSRGTLKTFVEIAVWHARHLGPAVRAVRHLVEHDAELAAVWARRSGRRDHIANVIDRLAADHQLRRGLRRRDAIALLDAFTLPDAVLACLAAGYTQPQATRLLHRAIEAAICDSRPDRPRPDPSRPSRDHTTGERT